MTERKKLVPVDVDGKKVFINLDNVIMVHESDGGAWILEFQPSGSKIIVSRDWMKTNLSECVPSKANLAPKANY